MGEALAALPACQGNILVRGPVQGEDPRAVGPRADRVGQVQRPRNGDHRRQHPGLADHSLGHHGTVGMADGEHPVRVDSIARLEIADRTGDVGDVIHPVAGRQAATATPGVPAKGLGRLEAGYRRSVQIGDDEAVPIGLVVHVQGMAGTRTGDPPGIAEPPVQDDHQGPRAAGRQPGRNVHDQGSTGLGQGLRRRHPCRHRRQGHDEADRKDGPAHRPAKPLQGLAFHDAPPRRAPWRTLERVRRRRGRRPVELGT